MQENVVVLARTPCPIAVIHEDAALSVHARWDLVLDLVVHSERFSKLDAALALYRGVQLHRLRHILEHGIDVEPSDAPIWVGDWNKALEYGGSSNVLLMLCKDKLDTTWRDIDAAMPAEELAQLRRTFPNVSERSGAKMRLSRLPEGEIYRGELPEVAYARWVPGDPWEALMAVFVVATEFRFRAVVDEIRGLLSDVSDRWH